MIYAINFLLDNFFFGSGYKVFRQIVGILMRMNCSPLLGDFFLYCFEFQFMVKFQKDPSRQPLGSFIQ
jgi:hypothetical protein